MDTLEFAKAVPPQKLAEIFKHYFEEHMAVYYMLKGMSPINIQDVSMNSSSIIYSIHVLDEGDRQNLITRLHSQCGSLIMYGKTYTPSVRIENDLLYITISK